MRKRLLNSSQVSILASAFIVILCTSALFLSGYAIQQRTLRELRRSIHPPEPPTVYLPDRFRLTEDLDEPSPASIPEDGPAVKKDTAGRESSQAKDHRKDVLPGQATAKQLDAMKLILASTASNSWAVANPDPLSKDKTPISRLERRKMIKDEIQRLAHSSEPTYWQRRLW